MNGRYSVCPDYRLAFQGTFKGIKPTQFTSEANTLASKIITRLWEDWGKDIEGLRNGDVDLYNGEPVPTRAIASR